MNPYAFIDNSQVYELTLFIRSIEIEMNALIFLPYLARTIRIWVVFNKDLEGKVWRIIFSSEIILIIVSKIKLKTKKGFIL